MTGMRDGVGICSTLAFTDPIVAMYLILCEYNTSRPGMLDLFLVLCKFLRSEVHGAVVVFTAIGLGPLVTV